MVPIPPTARPRPTATSARDRVAGRVVARADRRRTGRLGLGHRAHHAVATDEQPCLRRARSNDGPWVGRPIMLSDACRGRRSAPRRRTCGSAQTWSPAPKTSATATPRRPSRRSDHAHRRQPGSRAPPSRPRLRPRDHRLRGAAAVPPRGDRHADRGAGPGALRQLCAYQQGEGGFDLVYAATLDEATAQALYAGDGLGAKAARDFCGASSRSTSWSGSPARTPWATPS